ncbi:MAG: AraC family transcriptional regulator [Clostridiales Family XIII bacterium]|jgi:AraC-like DNA-binding protein|nr:AraC family transcriptional regulator [Clostridiales Family XIII bacterium]
MKTNLAVKEHYERDVDVDEFDLIPLSLTEACDGRPHRHPFYQIIYVEKMRGRHMLDVTPYDDFGEGLFVISPNQLHHWERVSEISGVVMRFGEQFFYGQDFMVNALRTLNMIRQLSGKGIRAEDVGMPDIRRLIGIITEEFEGKRDEWQEMVRASLNALVINLFRSEMRGDAGPKNYSKLYEEFQQLIIKNGGEVVPVRHYAETMKISMGYLNEQVRKNTGKTPGEMIRATIIDEARRLLANTDLSIGQIAKNLGFRDSAYFCRIFKKETGLSPLKFKKHVTSRPAGAEPVQGDAPEGAGGLD